MWKTLSSKSWINVVKIKAKFNPQHLQYFSYSTWQTTKCFFPPLRTGTPGIPFHRWMISILMSVILIQNKYCTFKWRHQFQKSDFFFPTSHASLANLIYFPSKYMYFSRLTVTPLSVELKSHFINSEYEFLWGSPKSHHN